MAEVCFVPQPKPGTGGCPCGTYPDPCGSVGECLPQGTPPAVTCFPPAASCRALGNCTTCEWIDPWPAQVCPGGAAFDNPLVVLLGFAGVAAGMVVAMRRRPVGAATVLGPRP